MVFLVILLLAVAVGAFIVYSRREPTALEREAAVDQQAAGAVAEEEELTVSATEQHEAAAARAPLSPAEREVLRDRPGDD
jgi:Tfp pilus assembly protein PilX